MPSDPPMGGVGRVLPDEGSRMELLGTETWEELQELGTISDRSLISTELMREEYLRLATAVRTQDPQLLLAQPLTGTFMGGDWRWFGTAADLLSLFREIFLYQHYAPLVPLPLIEDGSLRQIIDVGAHVGCFSLWATMALPKRSITCIEADPVTVEALRTNMTDRCRTHSVEVVHSAVLDDFGLGLVGDTDGRWGAESNRCMNSVRMPGKTDASSIAKSSDADVTIQTLDTFVHGPVDLLKVDIEGAELRVLSHAFSQGYRDQILQTVVEIGPATRASADDEPEDADRRAVFLAALLQDAGHSVDIFPTSRRPLAEKDPRRENFIIRSAQTGILPGVGQRQIAGDEPQ